MVEMFNNNLLIILWLQYDRIVSVFDGIIFLPTCLSYSYLLLFVDSRINELKLDELG